MSTNKFKQLPLTLQMKEPIEQILESSQGNNRPGKHSLSASSNCHSP